MKLRNIDVTDTVAKAKALADTGSLSAEAKIVIGILITIIELFAKALGANSRNSSKPPSQDPNRKKSTKAKGTRKPGGQPGHTGTTLEQVANPNEIVPISIDKRTLPKGKNFTQAEPIRRQVFNVQANIVITEYQAEVLVDEEGNRYSAEFPQGVDAPTQYGPSVRGLVAYMTNYQMTPAERTADHLAHHFGLPIGVGTVCNINADAGVRLQQFLASARIALRASEALHADETGVNVGGKRAWLHSLSNDKWTLFGVHAKRGSEGTDALEVVQNYTGILIHDNWSTYFKYPCQHALCNAHHLRELTRAFEDYRQGWAKDMHALLLDINDEVNSSETGCLSPQRAALREVEFDEIIRRGEVECPPPTPPPEKEKKRGRQKKSPPRNLLERLRERRREVLRFMIDSRVPFTNNQAERDIRMTKVHQKVSGCFRSMDGAGAFCVIRSFISTCLKHGLSPAEALTDLFRGKLPEFVETILDAQPQ